MRKEGRLGSIIHKDEISDLRKICHQSENSMYHKKGNRAVKNIMD